MTPRRTGTDGFFVSVLRQAKGMSPEFAMCSPNERSDILGPRRASGVESPRYDAVADKPISGFRVASRPRRVIPFHDPSTASRRVDALGGLGA